MLQLGNTWIHKPHRGYDHASVLKIMLEPPAASRAAHPLTLATVVEARSGWEKVTTWLVTWHQNHPRLNNKERVVTWLPLCFCLVAGLSGCGTFARPWAGLRWLGHGFSHIFLDDGWLLASTISGFHGGYPESLGASPASYPHKDALIHPMHRLLHWLACPRFWGLLCVLMFLVRLGLSGSRVWFSFHYCDH